MVYPHLFLSLFINSNILLQNQNHLFYILIILEKYSQVLSLGGKFVMIVSIVIQRLFGKLMIKIKIIYYYY